MTRAEPDTTSESMNSDPPRLLVLDMTAIGSLSATGQVKAQLFKGWPKTKLLQVACRAGNQLVAISATEQRDLSLEDAVDHCVRFAPNVIYCRPLDDPPAFREAVRRLLAELDHVPLVTHIMDDWPGRLRLKNPPEVELVDRELRAMLDRSAFRFVIGDKMAEKFERRYGLMFEPFANCVDRADWSTVTPDRAQLLSDPGPGTPFVLRYSGALADDMTKASVYDVAEAVDRVTGEVPVRFDLSVLPAWKKQAEADLDALSGVTVRAANQAVESYRAFVLGADACLIAYNFDQYTREYVSLSVANKLPDYLAAGRPILAYGPADLATIELCGRSGAAEVVAQRDASALDDAIRRLACSPERRQTLGTRGREFIFSVADADEVRNLFQERLRAAASGGGRTPTSGTDFYRFPRQVRASLNEASLMDAILSHHPRDSIMIDVGAHHGSELTPFVERGWRVYAFEPDPINRAKLESRLRRHPRIHIDPRAVSETEDDDVPFFRSEQSTGISTLVPFHDTHVEAGTVSTVRLDQFCSERHIDRIDYLKVDTEGHDLFVLRSLDWDATPPRAIQAEFEDSKTVPLGYDYHDLARFLLERGYDVWVSEWHPVIAYGSQHDWCRLARYPTELSNENAWGNLLAFRNSVSAGDMRTAAGLALSRGKAGSHTTKQDQAAPLLTSGQPEMEEQSRRRTEQTGKKVDAGSVLRSRYRRPAESGLRARLRELASAYQGLMALPSLAIALLYVSAVATVVEAGGTSAQTPVLLLAAAGMLTLAAIGAVVTRGRREKQRSVATLTQELSQVLDNISITHEQSSDAVITQVKELQVRFEGLSGGLEGLSGGLEDLRSRFDHAAEEIGRNEDRYRRSIHDLRSEFDAEKLHIASIENSITEVHQEMSVSYQSFIRSVDDADITTLTQTWARLLGLFTESTAAQSARHITYLADRIQAAERRSIGRLATSTQDMLLRMIVARAAARDAAAQGEPLHLLEIGTLFGVGLGLVGEACRGHLDKGFTLTAIDPLDGYYSGAHPDISTGEIVDRDAFVRNMSGFAVNDNQWRIIQRTNRDAIEEGSVTDRTYGVVVIDGDHSFDEVRFDFEAYRQIMGAGCYVIFDDYGSEYWPDVAKYVDEHVAPRSDVQFVGSSWHTAVVRVL